MIYLILPLNRSKLNNKCLKTMITLNNNLNVAYNNKTIFILILKLAKQVIRRGYFPLEKTFLLNKYFFLQMAYKLLS